ncbi:MAG: tetratricopeptide repeat protein [Candidatus Cloacimonetes bacterium]|nr:tetratricopeptide repeat protein [Candidatus Cloacimonadota bacterium]
MKFFLILFLLCIAAISLLEASIMFNYSRNEKTYVGINVDWGDPEAMVWFIPATDNNYGRVYFGFTDNAAQSGMNDQGLIYGRFATESLEITQSLGKPVYNDNLLDKIMAECATVKEALKLLENYNLEFFHDFQIMLVDKHANSAIVEGDIIHRKTGNYQIVTNFLISQYENEDRYPCYRYQIARAMLTDQGLSLELMRKILAATHQEIEYPTQFSCIYDLLNGIIFLYNFHDFENTVRINLKEALLQGEHIIKMADLFPRCFAYEDYCVRRPAPVSLEIERIINAEGIARAVTEYEKIRDLCDRRCGFDMAERHLDKLGHKLLEQGRSDEAVTVFKLNLETYNNSWKAFESLAEAYMLQGNITLAREHFLESIELNPNNIKAKENLVKLGAIH